MAALALSELRRALERRFPDALPVSRGTAAAATGVGALDGLLPSAGLPRGRLTAWAPGGGATAVLRSACEAAVGRGERAVWIDCGGHQAADFWRRGPLLIRPASERQGLEAAEGLLQSGGVALLVLHGGTREAEREAVRLSRAARAGGAALVLVVPTVSVAHLRVASRIAPEGYRWRCNAFGEPVEPVSVRLEVEASSMGWSGRTVVELPVRSYAFRIAPEPRLPDRRGAQTRTHAPWRPREARQKGARRAPPYTIPINHRPRPKGAQPRPKGAKPCSST